MFITLIQNKKRKTKRKKKIEKEELDLDLPNFELLVDSDDQKANDNATFKYALQVKKKMDVRGGSSILHEMMVKMIMEGPMQNYYYYCYFYFLFQNFWNGNPLDWGRELN